KKILPLSTARELWDASISSFVSHLSHALRPLRLFSVLCDLRFFSTESHRSQLIIDHPHLPLRLIERSRIINHVIGLPGLLFIRNLRRHPSRDLRASAFQISLHLRSPPLHSLLHICCHHNQPIESSRSSRFNNQGRFHHRNRIRLAAAHFLHPRFLLFYYGWMHDAVQFLYPRLSERSFREALAMDRFIFIQNLRAEVPHDLLIHRF